MAELNLWLATMDDDSFHDLPLRERMAFVTIAAMAADTEMDGFVEQSAIRRMPWAEGRQDLLESIEALVDAGLVIESIEPPGWNVEGWLADSRQKFRPTHVRLGWGQKPVARLQQRREENRRSSQRHRDKQRKSGKGDGSRAA